MPTRMKHAKAESVIEPLIERARGRKMWEATRCRVLSEVRCVSLRTPFVRPGAAFYFGMW